MATTSGGQAERIVSLVIAALAQVIASAPPDAIDLTIPRPCESRPSSGDEIVVCGRAPGELGPSRLPPLPARDSDIPKAETAIGKGIAIAGETEQADVGGVPSNRLMVRLKIKF
jgi:hypothetical protein